MEDSSKDALMIITIFAGVSHRSRHLVQDEIQVIARNTEDGVTDEIFFENFGEGAPSTVPSALTRWAEEGQILDAQGIHYCVAAVKPEILPVLLKHQAEEIAKGRVEDQKKKAEAQVKAAASKKEEETKKKQGSKDSGGESSTAAEGPSTTAEADAEADASEGQNEGMQVEQQQGVDATAAAATTSVPAASEPQGATTEDASMLVRLYMDEPAAAEAASTTSTDQASMRTSTPVNESEDHSPSASIMMSTATPASAVVQDIISAATVEAASLSAGDEVEAPAADSFQGSVGEAERTEQDAAQQESDGSPMALEEDGTAATPSGESAHDIFTTNRLA